MITRHQIVSGLTELTSHNIEVLKKLVRLCFPITYNNEFYEKCHLHYTELSRYVTVKDIPVGAIVCRLEKEEDSDVLYVHIMILLVFEKYRRGGLAQKMMKFLYDKVSKASFAIEYLDLHVQKVNTAAVQFYTREGFEIIEDLPGYYDLEQGDALHMRKKVVRDPSAPIAITPPISGFTLSKNKKNKSKVHDKEDTKSK